MSNYIFPSGLPGVDVKVSRQPIYDVRKQEAASGKELRYSLQFTPRYKYKLTFNMLRADTYAEFQQLAQFLARHFGELDSFLFSDPDDNAVTLHGFGKGDAAAVNFQLQRTMLGYVYDKLGGPWATRSLARTNLCLQSQTFGSATWTKTNTGSKTDTLAPDGTLTAAAYTATGTATITQSVAGLTAAAPYVLTGWARSTNAATLAIGTTEANSATVTLSTTPQRISVVFTAAGTSTTVTIGAGGTWTVGEEVELWGFQVEPGTAPSEYIATVAAAVTTWPGYWPTVTSGFEPVYDIAPNASIYVNNVLKTLTTDYAINSYGVVTFTAPPAANAQLAWSGSYYKRCRVDGEGVQLDRFMNQLYSGSVTLISVKP